MNKEDMSDITYPLKGTFLCRDRDKDHKEIISSFKKVRDKDPEFVKHEDQWYIVVDGWMLLPLDMTDEQIQEAKEKAKRWRSENFKDKKTEI